MFKKASEVQLADPQVEVREQPFQILHGAVEQPRQGTGDDRAELPAGEERDQHARDAGEDHRDDRPRDVERTQHGLEGRSLLRELRGFVPRSPTGIASVRQITSVPSVCRFVRDAGLSVMSVLIRA